MSFPNLGVLASLLVAIGCARGEDIVGGHVALIDAGLAEPPGETGGGPDQGSGGVVGSGGSDMGTGDVPQSSGGSTQGSGGTTSTSGGKTGTGGTTGSGGKSSNGGTTSGMGGTTSSGGKASGGAGGTSSGGSTSGGGNGGACPSGQKSCNGLCTPPAPRVGCGATGCDPCTLTAPQNGYVTCANNQCVFDCLSGYTKSGDKCVGTGAGGSTGTGSCTPASCPQNCSVVFGPACCTTDGKCGCPLVPWVSPTCVATK